MVKVEFHFDFGSPNAYLSHKVIPGIEARTGAKFAYVPVLLGGIFRLSGNRSPVEAFAGIKNKLEYQRLEMDRFVRHHKLDRFRMNPHFPVNTLAIMRGAVAAETMGVAAPYIDAVFRMMWEEGKKMDDPAVMQAALADAGLDAERLMALAATPEVKNRLIETTQASFERGTFGSPTFFVGDEIYFGKDRLGEVEEAILAATAG